MSMIIFQYIFTFSALIFGIIEIGTKVRAIETANKKNLFIEKTVAKLPRTTEPISYEINFNTTFDEDDSHFSGKVKISSRVVRNTSQIVLNSKSLAIKNVRCFQIPGERTENTCSHKLDTEKEFLIVHGNTNFTKDETVELLIDFVGSIRNDDCGYFRKTYEGPDRGKRFVEATQFEPIGARLVFPCYDEPEYKATVQLNITHSNDFVALSNMPLQGTPKDNSDGTLTSIFQTTPEMSTYLIAFAMGDFRTSKLKPTDTRATIYTRPEYGYRQQYANEINSITLQSLEKYFDNKIPLPKIDNLAIPSFKWPAMENWGLITYSERNLITYKDRSVEREMKIASTIAHEYAHQWIGNLVTPAWWSYMWLSEGLVTMLEYPILQTVNSSWDMDQIFITNRMQKALADDINDSTNPLTFWPRNNLEINEVFNSLTYNKGACIFRMISHVLTEQTFQKAIRKIIKDRQYKTITPDTLTHFLIEATSEDGRFENSDINLGYFLKSWTTQSGYPLVTVERDYESGTFRLHQEPFNEEEKTTGADHRVWWIPFNYVTKNIGSFKGTTIDGYLDNSGDQTISPALKMWTNKDWLILNKQQTGFYRVNYDATNWGLITEALLRDHESIHAINRAQLIDDAYHLVLSHRLHARVLLNILKYMVQEDDYAPWKTFEKIWSSLKHKLSDHQDTIILKTWVKDLTAVPYERFQLYGKPHENHLKRLTRNIIVGLACEIGYDECLKDSKTELKNILMNRSEKLYHDDKKTILCTGMITATHLDFSMLLSTLVKSRDLDERREYMDALGCMNDAALIKLYITTAMKRTFDINYSHEERLYVIQSIVKRSNVGVQVAIEFLLENTFEYARIKVGNKNALLEAVQEIGKYVDKRLQPEFRRLLSKLEKHGLISSEHARPVEKVARRNIDWAHRYRKPFVEWLQAYTFEKKSKITSTSSATSNIWSWTVLNLAIVFSIICV